VKVEWKPLKTTWNPAPRVLEETLIGGQSFRWWWSSQLNGWIGIIENNIFFLRKSDVGLEFATPTNSRASYLLNYLGDDKQPLKFPELDDSYYTNLKKEWLSLKILRQPPGEVILGFLCSSNKQIIQIRQMLNALATRFGNEILPGVFALPNWTKLAEVSLAELQNCSLGYRAKYVFLTAQILGSNHQILSNWGTLDDVDLRSKLLELPGIGPKVADCVLLFGYGRKKSFPLDTWIEKEMRKNYRLKNWNVEQIRHFAQIHFGENAGVIQQWIFAEGRKEKSSRLRAIATADIPEGLTKKWSLVESEKQNKSNRD